MTKTTKRTILTQTKKNCYGIRHEGVQRPKRKWRKQQFWRQLQKFLSAMAWGMRGPNSEPIADRVQWHDVLIIKKPLREVFYLVSFSFSWVSVRKLKWSESNCIVRKNLKCANLPGIHSFSVGERGNRIDSAHDRITNLVLTAGQQVPQFQVYKPSAQVGLNFCKNLHHYICNFGDTCRLLHHLPWRLWFQVWKLVCSWWSALMPVFYTFHLFLTDHFGSWNSMSPVNHLVQRRS